MEFIGSKSRSGTACIGVGGGAFSNTLQGRMILRDGKKPHALFTKSKGELASSIEQAIVPIQLGDIILVFEGKLPATLENPDLVVRAYRITGIREGEGDSLRIETEETPFLPEWEEEVPWHYLGVYHNREGWPFVS